MRLLRYIQGLVATVASKLCVLGLATLNEIQILSKVGGVHVQSINPLNPELNPICYLPALLGAHHFLHISRIRVKLLTF